MPLVGRPAELPFSGASAGFAVGPGPEYRAPLVVTAIATPTTLEELDAITFTLSVHALTSVQQPPRRLDLRQVPALARRFHVEDVTDGHKGELSATAWQWTYRLRPKAAGIDAIPGVPFVFYNPDVRPVEKAFQVLWTDPIALSVGPAEQLAPPIEAPASALELVTGDRVLRTQSAWLVPGPWLIGVVVVGTPCGCVVWYLAWRRKYPNAARQARERQSRAARQALRRLDGAKRLQGRRCADEVSRTLTEYLHERYDFRGAEPTPDEVGGWLTQRGVEGELVARLQGLLRACAAERFQPERAVAGDLIVLAREWILIMEESKCPPSS